MGHFPFAGASDPRQGVIRLMSRLSLLASQPKLALGALLTLLLAAAAVVGSGADFTATSANPSNTFASGTLTIGNSKEGTAILTASNMRPGAAATIGTVDIQNTGSLSGVFTLSRTAPVDSDSANPLSAKLNVTVVDCGAFAGSTAPTCGDGDDVTKYSAGTLAQMGTPVTWCPRSARTPATRSTATSSASRSTAPPGTPTRATTRRSSSTSTPPQSTSGQEPRA